MKKVFVFMLLAALVVNLVLPVSAAVGSPAAKEEDLLPILVSSSCDDLKLYTLENPNGLTQEAQQIFAQAAQALADAVPEGTRVRQFFYADLCDVCEDCTATFRPADNREPMVIQYIEGEWVELEVTINEDGTITVHGMVDGPVAFLIQLQPTVVESECVDLNTITEPEFEEAPEKIPEEIRNRMDQAQRSLAAAIPEGMLVRYFFYADICEQCTESTVVFHMDSYLELLGKTDAPEDVTPEQPLEEESDNLVIKQFVDSKWVEVEYTINKEAGTVAVEGVVDGPMAFFVK